MTQKIKVTAEIEVEDRLVFDDLSIEASLGLLGTIKSYNIDYEEKVDELPKVNSNELWLIEYKVDGQTYNNHYVSYSPPMKFEIYKAWLSELKR